MWPSLPRAGTARTRGAPARLAAGRLSGPLALGRRRDLPAQRRPGLQLELLAEVRDPDAVAVLQRVVGAVAVDLDEHPALGDRDPEGQAPEARGQARREGQLAVVVAEAAEARDERQPRSGQRGDVQAVARVVLQVVEVHERR